MKTSIVRALIAAGLTLAGTGVFAQANPPERGCPYDFRLLTEHECRVYRVKVVRAKSGDERYALREELDRVMESRAKARGIALDDWRGLEAPPLAVGATR